MQKQAQAEWLRACIEQRSHTLQRIADILVDFQRMFLDSGKDMKPIRQKDVAQIMEVNESTISRAVKGNILSSTETSYDFMGRAIQTKVTSDGVTQTESKTYDDNGTVATETSASGIKTAYRYDSLNRVIKATEDQNLVCDLHHSSQQCQILNPLSKARDRTCILMDTSQVHYR